MNITLIGAGNVGYHLALILQKKGHQINQIYSRNAERFGAFDPKIFRQTHFITSFQQIAPPKKTATTAPTFYIIAVSDNAIEEVSNQLAIKGLAKHSIVAHTSGATPMSVLSQHQHHGIFYPLQTFTRSRPADWNSLPFCIHANDPATMQTLAHVAKTVNDNIYFINDQERQLLHVAAVFVNNFTNHLLTVAEDILKNNQLTLDILRPLIRETFAKAQQQSPQNNQTGPARRNDSQTIEKHLKLLKSYPDYEKLYQVLTKSIQNKYFSK